MSRPLRLRIVLPGISPSGGVRAVLSLGRALRASGHDVLVVAVARRPSLVPSAAGLFRTRDWLARQVFERVPQMLDHYGARDWVREVPRVTASTVPPGDAVVATAWDTAESVLELPASAGAKAYFIQGYEAYTPELEPRVNATWQLPLRRITVSQWLSRLGADRFGVECHGPVGCGVDGSWFRPASIRAEAGAGASPSTVGAVYHPLPGKGVEDLIATLRSISEARPATRIVVFGRHRLTHTLPQGAKYLRAPAWKQIAELYRSFDVFLHTSHREGWGLPPMEAMSSGCAVVTTDAGGVPEFADEQSARIVTIGDRAGMLAAALALLESPGERVSLGRAARAKVAPLTWERAARRFETALGE